MVLGWRSVVLCRGEREREICRGERREEKTDEDLTVGFDDCTMRFLFTAGRFDRVW